MPAQMSGHNFDVKDGLPISVDGRKVEFCFFFNKVDAIAVHVPSRSRLKLSTAPIEAWVDAKDRFEDLLLALSESGKILPTHTVIGAFSEDKVMPVMSEKQRFIVRFGERPN